MIKTTIGIEGMMCGMCEAHVNDVIRKHFNVKSTKADRRKKQCVVISENPLDEDVLRRAISDTGYEVTSVSSKPYVKKGLFPF